MIKAYGIYRKVRNASWQALIDNSIVSLPVDVVKITKQNGITLLMDSDAKELRDGEAGISIYDGSEWFVIYDDSLPIGRIVFTIAHELGHIFLGHPLIAGYHIRAKDGNTRPRTELEADSFATRLLTPACVLWGLNIKTAADILRVCDVPNDIAKTRAARMGELYKREKFLTSPLEAQVFEQFKAFIEQQKNMPPK